MNHVVNYDHLPFYGFNIVPIGVTRLDSYDDCDNTAVELSVINSKLPSSSLVPTISYRFLYNVKNFKILLVEKIT